MDRKTFLKELEKLWIINAEMREPLTLQDLLDDAGSLGVIGATGLYMRLMRAEDISKSDGRVLTD